MQIDTRLIKTILNNIQFKESHYVNTVEILQDIKADFEYIEKETFIDIFFGHLLLLKDNKVIEEVSGNNNLGISYCANKIMSAPCKIRLTSTGYDFIKILNKDNMVDKLKKMTLRESLKIAEHLLLKGVDNFIF